MKNYKAIRAGDRHRLRDRDRDGDHDSHRDQPRRDREAPTPSRAGDRQKVRVFHSIHIVTIDRDQPCTDRAVKEVQATCTAIAEYCQSSAWTIRAEIYGFSEPIHRRKSVLIRADVRDPTQGKERLMRISQYGYSATRQKPPTQRKERP